MREATQLLAQDGKAIKPQWKANQNSSITNEKIKVREPENHWTTWEEKKCDELRRKIP